MFDVTLTDHFQYQSQFVDTEIIKLQDQKKNVQITDKIIYRQIWHFPFDVCRWLSLDHWTDLDPQKY